MKMNANVFKSMFMLSILAAVVATICDANHAHTGALSYPHPLFFNQAGWVFPGFVLAFLSMAFIYYTTAPLISGSMTNSDSTTEGPFQPLVETLISFMLVYLMSGFGNDEPALLAFIFYGTFTIRLMFTYERMFILIVALALAFGGMFVEGLMTQLDQVHYRQPEIFGVPFWLGGLYMHGALCLREGMRFFVYND